jgi:hypothetical protein
MVSLGTGAVPPVAVSAYRAGRVVNVFQVKDGTGQCPADHYPQPSSRHARDGDSACRGGQPWPAAKEPAAVENDISTMFRRPPCLGM